eukprot:15477825-Alexandrium_andersonii.AAC.1
MMRDAWNISFPTCVRLPSNISKMLSGPSNLAMYRSTSPAFFGSWIPPAKSSAAKGPATDRRKTGDRARSVLTACVAASVGELAPLVCWRPPPRRLPRPRWLLP